MRSFLFLLSIILMIGSPVYSQVDTLRLVEVNNIDVPEDITEIYAEDFDNDGIKELIVCTHDYIYIYNSQTNELLWTSPELFSPQDLIFTDINGDETVDIAVRDSLNIFIFDITNSFILWSSPYLDATFRCYTIGDRNNDELLDVAIVRQVRTNSNYDYDTVYVDYYNGPSFLPSDYFSMLVPRYSYSGHTGEYSVRESPRKIIISPLTSGNDLCPTAILFTNKYSFDWWLDQPLHSRTYGRTYIIDGMDNLLLHGYTSGLLKHECSNTIFDQTQLFTINASFEEEGPYDWEYTLTYNFISSNADSVLDVRILFNNVYDWDPSSIWHGFKVADLNELNNNDELFMAYMDSVFLYTYPEMELLWYQSDVQYLHQVLDCVRYSSIFDNPQAICGFNEPDIGYIRKFISGADGSLTAVLYLPGGFNYHKIVDLNNDNDNEFLSIQGNVLRIYHLDDYVNIDEPIVSVPTITSISQNYPNPFNASTTIGYTLPYQSDVTIDIYDILGRRVEILMDKHQQPGHHQVTWDAPNVTSGIYFYRIQAGEYVETKKMMLLR